MSQVGWLAVLPGCSHPVEETLSGTEIPLPGGRGLGQKDSDRRRVRQTAVGDKHLGE
jgi:hypothetical protein